MFVFYIPKQRKKNSLGRIILSNDAGVQFSLRQQNVIREFLNSENRVKKRGMTHMQGKRCHQKLIDSHIGNKSSIEKFTTVRMFHEILKKQPTTDAEWTHHAMFTRNARRAQRACAYEAAGLQRLIGKNGDVLWRLYVISSIKEVVEDKGKLDCAKHSITLQSHWK